VTLLESLVLASVRERARQFALPAALQDWTRDAELRIQIAKIRDAESAARKAAEPDYQFVAGQERDAQWHYDNNRSRGNNYTGD
jgi:hypothetical protein